MEIQQSLEIDCNGANYPYPHTQPKDMQVVANYAMTTADLQKWPSKCPAPNIDYIYQVSYKSIIRP